MAKKNKEHDHDPRRCPTCRKLRTVWTANGFAEAVQMLERYYKGVLWPRVSKSWRDLPPDLRGQEIIRISDEAWDRIQEEKKARAKL